MKRSEEADLMLNFSCRILLFTFGLYVDGDRKWYQDSQRNGFERVRSEVVIAKVKS